MFIRDTWELWTYNTNYSDSNAVHKISDISTTSYEDIDDYYSGSGSVKFVDETHITAQATVSLGTASVIGILIS